MPIESTPDALTLKPTRRLKPAARKVFDKVSSGFVHLAPTDAETLTAYSEWSAIYAEALRETQRSPLVTVPIVNRSTGNVVGERTTRNPMFATLSEAQAHVTSLGRRLLIDAHSAEKRQRLLTKKARALAAAEHAQAESTDDVAPKWSEEEIAKMMRRLAPTLASTPAVNLRSAAICQLELIECAADPECADILLANPPKEQS